MRESSAVRLTLRTNIPTITTLLFRLSCACQSPDMFVLGPVLVLLPTFELPFTAALNVTQL